MRDKGNISVLLSAVCFSLAGVLIKSIPWSPLSIGGGRAVFATAVMLLYMKKEHIRLVWNSAVLIGTVCNFVMSITFIFATKMTTAANAIVL